MLMHMQCIHRGTGRQRVERLSVCNCTVCPMQATAESAALQPPDSSRSSSSSYQGSSSSKGPPGTRDAVYLKSPLSGGVVEYPGRSVVVLGDVPAGEVHGGQRGPEGVRGGAFVVRLVHCVLQCFGGKGMQTHSRSLTHA